MSKTLKELQKFTEKLTLRDAELHLMKQLLDKLPIAVHVISIEGKTFYTNAKALDTLGSEIASHGISKNALFSDKKSGKVLANKMLPITHAIKGEHSSKADMVIESEGEQKRVCCRAVPIHDHNGSVTHALSTFYIVQGES
jgi:hypothetical protein